MILDLCEIQLTYKYDESKEIYYYIVMYDSIHFDDGVPWHAWYTVFTRKNIISPILVLGKPYFESI